MKRGVSFLASNVILKIIVPVVNEFNKILKEKHVGDQGPCRLRLTSEFGVQLQTIKKIQLYARGRERGEKKE